jgi:hypothetical protein
MKYFWARFFVSDEAGVGDAPEAVGDPAPLQNVFDFAIGIGDDGDLISAADFAKSFRSAGADVVPVGGIPDACDQVIADCVVFQSNLGQKLGVEHPPKTMVAAAGPCEYPGHDSVKLIFSPAFQVPELLSVEHNAAFAQRRVNALVIGKEQSVSHIEEDESD